MTFNRNNCVIRKVYCGDGHIPKDTKDKKYSRQGSVSECLRRGYGIAQWEMKKKNLSPNSLQHIPYIGPVFEAAFRKNKITGIKSLLNKMALFSTSEKKAIIIKCCTRKNNTVDFRAVNSVILFLHDNGVNNLPNCKIVRE